MVEFFQTHIYIIAQIFGFGAMAVAIVMYQSNKHKNILLLMMLCSTLWCVHFGLLGHWTAVAMNGLNVVRNIVFCFRERKWGQSNLIPILFIVISLILTIFTYEDLWSVVPFIASIFAITSVWQTNTKILRFLSVPVCICWFVYNIFHDSWAGTANEAFTLISLTIAIVRYDILKKTEVKK